MEEGWVVASHIERGRGRGGERERERKQKREREEARERERLRFPAVVSRLWLCTEESCPVSAALANSGPIKGSATSSQHSQGHGGKAESWDAHY